MRTYLDCIPCFIRQTIDACRMVSKDSSLHEKVVRKVLEEASLMEFNTPPPVMGQKIHRWIREATGISDPYKEAKQRQNSLALDCYKDMLALVETSADPLLTAVRLAIAGNVIDMGVGAVITGDDVKRAVRQALAEPFSGDVDGFVEMQKRAGTICYIADNAGEIVFDRILIEKLGPQRVLVVVRAGPVINDATLEDAKTVGLDRIAKVIHSGSDAPGIILSDCAEEFKKRFYAADMVIAKGQGNYETLSDVDRDIFFLFKAKCDVVASHANVRPGCQVMIHHRPDDTSI